MRVSIKRFLGDESGQEIVEYALVMGLIAVGSVVVLKGLAASIATGVGSIGTHVTNATS